MVLDSFLPVVEEGQVRALTELPVRRGKPLVRPAQVVLAQAVRPVQVERTEVVVQVEAQALQE